MQPLADENATLKGKSIHGEILISSFPITVRNTVRRKNGNEINGKFLCPFRKSLGHLVFDP